MNVNETRHQMLQQYNLDEHHAESMNTLACLKESLGEISSSMQYVSIELESESKEIRKMHKDLLESNAQISEAIKQSKEFGRKVKIFNQECRDRRNNSLNLIERIQKIFIFIFCLIKGVANCLEVFKNNALMANSHIFRGPYCWVLPRRYNIDQ